MNNKNVNWATYIKPIIPWYMKIWYIITFQWKKLNNKWELLGTISFEEALKHIEEDENE